MLSLVGNRAVGGEKMLGRFGIPNFGKSHGFVAFFQRPDDSTIP